MKFIRSTAFITAAFLAAMPIMQVNAAEAPLVSEKPVYEFFNENDVNGAVGIKLPEGYSAHVEITFDSPEGLALPYYVTDVEKTQAAFEIEGHDNTEDDYRNYHISITVKGGKLNAVTDPITDTFTVADVNDNPNSYTGIAYNFTLAEEGSDAAMVELTSEDEQKLDNGTLTVKNYTLNMESFIKGDVNGDGSVDGTDAAMVLNEFAVTGAEQPSTFDNIMKAAGDINGDGSIDGSDAGLILRYYAYEGKVSWENIIAGE